MSYCRPTCTVINLASVDTNKRVHKSDTNALFLLKISLKSRNTAKYLNVDYYLSQCKYECTCLQPINRANYFLFTRTFNSKMKKGIAHYYSLFITMA